MLKMNDTNKHEQEVAYKFNKMQKKLSNFLFQLTSTKMQSLNINRILTWNKKWGTYNNLKAKNHQQRGLFFQLDCVQEAMGNIKVNLFQFEI